MRQDVKNFVEEIKAAGGTAELYLYEGEQHAFMNEKEDSIERMQSAPAAALLARNACMRAWHALPAAAFLLTAVTHAAAKRQRCLLWHVLLPSSHGLHVMGRTAAVS